jgi:hypothetical protein
MVGHAARGSRSPPSSFLGVIAGRAFNPTIREGRAVRLRIWRTGTSKNRLRQLVDLLRADEARPRPPVSLPVLQFMLKPLPAGRSSRSLLKEFQQTDILRSAAPRPASRVEQPELKAAQ